MSLNQRRTLTKAFIESHFRYCPLVWMFQGIMVNKKVNHLHETALRIVYKDYISFLKTFFKEINLSLFTIGTFSHWLLKVKQNLSIQCYVTYCKHD